MANIEVLLSPEISDTRLVEEMKKCIIDCTSKYFDISKDAIIISIDYFPLQYHSRADVLIRGETSIWKKDRIKEWGDLMFDSIKKLLLKELDSYKEIKYAVKTVAVESQWKSSWD